MFATLSRSWRYATLSYTVLWNHKQLLIFPVFSTLAALVVLASFGVPLWLTGAWQDWSDQAQQAGGDTLRRTAMYAVLFAFYFCNYFVIVFFNSALIAAVMQSLGGGEPTIGGSLSAASRRLPQIVAWSLVSAFIGVVLRAIENMHEKAGGLVASLLGSGWTVLTYFVVPSIVLEGLGPIAAIKRSASTLKNTWGTALVGNFSLGLLGFLIMLPVYLLALLAIGLGVWSGHVVAMVAGIAVGVLLIAAAAATSSAANVVFTAVLYAHATGRTLPANLEAEDLSSAFTTRSK